MPNTVITYAVNGREQYTQGVPRLISSIHAVSPGNMPGISYYVPGGLQSWGAGVNAANDPRCRIPQHQAVPYGFKPALFEYAFNVLGSDCVLWCDATITAQRDITSVFKQAREHGVAAFDNPGCPLLHWTSDGALRQMGVTLEEGAKVNSIMACAVAICNTHPVGAAIMSEWLELAYDGITFSGGPGAAASARPEYRAHRHDQSALSWLLHKHRVPVTPYGSLCYYSDRVKFAEQCVLTNQGIGQT